MTEEEPKITWDEFAIAWMVAKERLRDLPNIRTVIDLFVQQLWRERNRQTQSAGDEVV